MPRRFAISRSSRRLPRGSPRSSNSSLTSTRLA
jgi:hypothetical protein